MLYSIQKNILNDFNPRSPSGLRLFRNIEPEFHVIFQSTQPEWAATNFIGHSSHILAFQSTQPEWAATQKQVHQ